MVFMSGPQRHIDVHAAVGAVVAALDPVMVPLGFAAGQSGASDRSAQVIYCEAHPAGDGLCADVTIDLEQSAAGWRITSVDYDGFIVGEASPLRLDRDIALPEQVARLGQTIRDDLGRTDTAQ